MVFMARKHSSDRENMFCNEAKIG
uniref:Uncharacterized protein n=1 Tax=Rhizophora mucronata TaxID=61149 RepID=A0A2P2R399_RHIMU